MTRFSKRGGESRRNKPFKNRRFGNKKRGGNFSKKDNINISRFINKGEDLEVAPYNPKHTFNDFVLDKRIKDNIAIKGYISPSAIQDQSIPVILEGRDIVGIANTGTGKTGAFLIPLIDKVLKSPNEKVIVMVPTRELSNQINQEFHSFSKNLNIRSVSIVGGENIQNQMRLLRNNPNFIFGTPGRIKDLIERKALNLSRFQTVVLDEADRMLDMGFIHDMRKILDLMPTKKHTLFFSATLSKEIDKLIKDFLTDPVRIFVKTGDTSKTIDQDVLRLEGKDKVEALFEVLNQPGFDKVIVFGRTKHGIDNLAKSLSKKGITSALIHGNKSQSQRQRALDSFKQDKVRVLLATDVAARGIDIPKVSHVINYDIPATYDDYIHRIGRTGRAGERGKALTFVN